MLFTKVEIFISISAKTKHSSMHGNSRLRACSSFLCLSLFPECSRVLKFWVQSINNSPRRHKFAPRLTCTGLLHKGPFIFYEVGGAGGIWGGSPKKKPP